MSVSEMDERRASEMLSKATADEVHLLHQVMLEGAVFLKYGKSGQPRWKQVSCDTSGKDMKLQWAPLPTDKDKDAPKPTGYIRLADVTMLLKGKETKVFSRKVAQSAPNWLCFSIVTKKRTLDLQAASGNQRDLWVRAIAQMVTNLHAKKVQRPVDAPASRTESNVSASVSISNLPDPTEPIANDAEDDLETRTLKFLNDGAELTKHGRSGNPKVKHVFATKDKLFWAKPKSNLNKAKSHIKLVKIKGVLTGKNTEVFGRKGARGIPGSSCFSIIADEKTLDLQCKDKDERDAWVKALRIVIRGAKQKEELVRRILTQKYRQGTSRSDETSLSEQPEYSYMEEDAARPPSHSDDEVEVEPDSPPPPPPPDADDPEAWKAYEAAKQAKQKQTQKKIDDKNRRERRKERQKAKADQEADEEEANRQLELEAQRRIEAEKLALEQAKQLAQTEENAQAQAEALEQAEKRAAMQADALAKAQEQVKALEDQLRLAKERSAEKRRKADEEAKRQAEEQARIAEEPEETSEPEPIKDDTDVETKETTEDSKDDTSEANASLTFDESITTNSETKEDSTMDPPKSLLKKDKKDKKKGGGGGLRWADNIAEVKEVEKIIILSPDYGMDDDEDTDDMDLDDDQDSDAEDEEAVYEDEDEEEEEEEDLDAEEDAGPKLDPIRNVKKFMHDMIKHREVLCDEKKDWNIRAKAMKAIQGMIENKDLAAIGEPWWKELDKLRRGIIIQIEDLRSAIVKDACNLLIALTDVLGHEEDYATNFLKTMLPIMFKRLYVTIKAIAQPSDETVRAMLTRAYFWSFKCIPEILKAAAQDSHSIVRSKCTEYLTQILNECPDEQFSSVFVYEKKLASLIKKNINDSDKKVRASSRQLFLAFANVWPQLAHKLYDKFNGTTQRTITAELKKMMD